MANISLALLVFMSYINHMDAAQPTTQETAMNPKLNDIVRGHVAGVFKVIGFVTIGGEQAVKLKPVHPETHQPGRGQLALPVSALRPL